MRATVRPAVLLPVGDDVVGVRRVDGHVRLHFSVLVEDAAGARLPCTPAAGRERAEPGDHARGTQGERRRSTPTKPRSPNPLRRWRGREVFSSDSSDPGTPCPGVSGVASNARRSVEPTLRPSDAALKPSHRLLPRRRCTAAHRLGRTRHPSETRRASGAAVLVDQRPGPRRAGVLPEPLPERSGALARRPGQQRFDRAGDLGGRCRRWARTRRRRRPRRRSSAATNWSEDIGPASTGKPWLSASITVLLPPWQTTASQAASDRDLRQARRDVPVLGERTQARGVGDPRADDRVDVEADGGRRGSWPARPRGRTGTSPGSRRPSGCPGGAGRAPRAARRRPAPRARPVRRG